MHYRTVSVVLLVFSLLLFTLPAWATQAPLVAYLTDLEGSHQKLEAFFAASEAFTRGADGHYHLKRDAHFVYGGDLPDRYYGSLAIVDELLRLKEEAVRAGRPDQVTFVVGNRDLNKLRLRAELAIEALAPPPVWFPWVAADQWAHAVPPGRTARLRYILERTMGAPKAFELRRAELAARMSPAVAVVSDDKVVDSFLAEMDPGGKFFKLLRQGKLAHRIGNTLFLHGGVTPENFGIVPGRKDRHSEVDVWVQSLNRWYEAGLSDYETATTPWSGQGPRPGEAIIRYPMPDVGQTLKQESVVYGRNAGAFNMPHLPPMDVLQALLSQGITRVVTGHIPTGDTPVVMRLSDESFEAVSADNSYSTDESNAAVVHFRGNKTSIRARVKLNTGEWVATATELELGKATPIGKRLDDGSLLVTQRGSAYIAFRSGEKFAVTNRLVPEPEVRRSRLLAPVAELEPAPGSLGPVAYLSGIFDPPTLADKAVFMELLKQFPLEKLYIVVKFRDVQECDASVVERMDMLKVMLRDALDRIEIRGEPFQGEEAFLRAISHDGERKVYRAIEGDHWDTLPAAMRRDETKRWVLIAKAEAELKQGLPKGVQWLRVARPADSKVDPAVDAWIRAHAETLYVVPKPEHLAERESNYEDQFALFSQELKARLPQLALRNLPPPPFRATQSHGAWLETFIRWTLDQHHFDETTAGEFADAARVVFHPRAEEFPIASLKSGVPSSRCLRYLRGLAK